MNDKKTYYGQNKKKLKKEERIHSVNGKVKAKEYNKNKKKRLQEQAWNCYKKISKKNAQKRIQKKLKRKYVWRR